MVRDRRTNSDGGGRLSEVRRAVLAGLVICCLGAAVAQLAAAALYATSLRRLSGIDIDDGGRRLMAAPLILRLGQRIEPRKVIEHLQRIGYYDSATSEAASYSATSTSVTVHPRFREFQPARI